MMRRDRVPEGVHNGTTTDDGYIPHLKVLWDGGSIAAPVMIRRTIRYGQNAYVPLVRNGHYIHALPGGFEIIGSAAT